MSDYIPPPRELKPGSIVWGYYRDSGGDSQEQSVNQQKEEIKAYCDRYGLILGMTFADEAKSGGSISKRDAFNEMIDICSDSNNRPDGVLLWNLARFSRNLNQSMLYKAWLREKGIIVHSITDPIPAGDFGPILETLIDFSNEQKRRQNSRDTRRALQALVKQGFTSGGTAPRGYMLESHPLGKKRDGSIRKVSRLIPDPDTVGRVKLAWRLRAEGKPYGEIREATGGLYKSKNSWQDFFKNKTYLGIGKCGDLEVPDHHEPLIDLATWEKVQKIRDSNPRTGKRGSPHNPRRVNSLYLLSGLAVCPYCGSGMIANTSGNGWKGYVCGKKQRQGFKSCEGRLVNKQKAEKAILDYVWTRVLTIDYFYQLLEETQKQYADTSRIDLQLDALKKADRALKTSINKLIDAIEKSNGNLSSLVNRLQERENEQARLKVQIEQLEIKKAAAHVEISPEALLLVFNAWRDQIQETRENQGIRALRNMLKRFVGKVELDYNKARIWYEYPLNDLKILDRSAQGWGHTIKKTVLQITLNGFCLC